jgi:hypothetical protein
MEPARTIIKALGGPSEVAKITGVHRTRVSNWMRAKDAGGTSGRIPQNHHRAILAAAASRGLSFTADDLLPRGEDDINWRAREADE